jgi:hypothetical protein
MALAYKEPMAFPVRLHADDPIFLRVLAHFAPAPRATLLAMIVGFLTICVLAPLAAVPPFVLVTILIGVPMGLTLSLPVTFVALPLCALAFGPHPTARKVALPLAGLVTGAAVPGLVFLGSNSNDWLGIMMFVVAGAIAGLAVGIYFARKTGQLYSAQERLSQQRESPT